MKPHTNYPPRFPLRFFRWYCHPKLLKYIEGDLMELYQERKAKSGKLKADARFIIDVLLLFRPAIIKPVEGYKNLNTYGMYKSYFKIGWRNLIKSKGYSFINIGGLAVGIAVAMLIGLWIHDELSYNKYHRNYNRVAQVMQHQTFNGYKGTENSIPIPLVTELQKSYGNDFKYLVMTSWMGDHILKYGEKKFSKSGNYMDLDAPRLLDLKMLAGSLDGLKEPGSILLSQSVAKAFFGEKDPMNELMRIDNKLDVKVTGVYEDLPFATQFRELSFIAPWELYVSSEEWVKNARDEGQWGNNSFQLFAQIADHADMENISAKIKNAKQDHVPEDDKIFKAEIFLHPMKDWHLNSNWENGVHKGGFIQYVWLFGIVGIFVLMLACINFMNLSTARSEQRAKEVGIRKSIGSLRSQLVSQFLSESFLVVMLAFMLAIILVTVSIPSFNQLADKQMIFPLTNISFWLISLGFIALTGMLAGSYPALYLSSFQPVRVLKGTFQAGRFASLPRKVLVVLQFTVSVTLIIGTTVVYRQVQFTKNRPVGYDQNGIIMIQMKSPDYYGKYDLLQLELKNAGAIEEMAESSSPLTGVWSNNGGFNWQGKDPALQAEFATIWVTHDFGKTVEWQIKEGRDFSRDFASDSSGIIINEAAVKFMDLKTPLGTIVRWGDDVHGKDFKIIGVVKDMLMESPFKSVKQTVYLNGYENVNWIELRLNSDKSFNESISKVESVFKKHLPDVPFDYEFADQEHALKFASEEKVGKLSGIFASLAVFISCLGLSGLASFVAEQRTKEIGIRKVLGASVANLWQMLSKDFVILVILSCFIAIPVAWYFLNDWLQGYDYRTEISWWIFLVTGMGALIITILTVSFQAVKAALMNPVKSLRSE
ncbi:MAG: ABC transporter permease [Bacteroidota bacterium]